MSLTLPQVYLMGHAAWVSDQRSKSRRGSEDTQEESSDDPWVTINNKRKRFSEMTSEDQEEYYGRW